LQGHKASPSNSTGGGGSGKSSAAQVLSSHEALKIKKAWEFATSPLKSLPMQAFMLYMSGGGVQVFSMGIVAMLLLSPFKNLSGMNAGACFFFSFLLCGIIVNAPLLFPFHSITLLYAMS